MIDRSMLRTLAMTVAGLFFVATLFQLIDQLNLIYQPPNVPDSANLVDRVTALIPYRHDVWPIFFGANALLGLGFLVIIGLGLVLAGRVARSDDRRNVLLWTLATAGLLGTVGQLILLGAVKASIDIPYCDCGFKTQEIVSQVWAEMVAQSAVQWLIYGATVVGAVGIALAGRLFGGRSMSPSWALLSYGTAILLVISVLLGFADVGGDATSWLTVLVSGVAIPAWALWLGLRFRDADSLESATAA